MCCRACSLTSPWQVGVKPNSELIAEASQHLALAREARRLAGVNDGLNKKMMETETAMASVEAWARGFEEGEVALQRGKEALAKGDRDEAAGHCRVARELLNGGLQSEALRGALQELEQDLNAGFRCIRVSTFSSS